MEIGSDAYNTLYSILVMVVAYTAYMLMCEALARRSFFFALMALVGWCYPLGKGLQAWLVGPSWIRWHMADVGWVSFVGILLASSVMIRYFNNGGIRLLFGVAGAAAVALVSEIVQMFLLKKPDQSDILGVAGDWVDVAIFLVMFLVNVGLVLGYAWETRRAAVRET